MPGPAGAVPKATPGFSAAVNEHPRNNSQLSRIIAYVIVTHPAPPLYKLDTRSAVVLSVPHLRRINDKLKTSCADSSSHAQLQGGFIVSRIKKKNRIFFFSHFMEVHTLKNLSLNVLYRKIRKIITEITAYYSKRGRAGRNRKERPPDAFEVFVVQ